MIRLVHLILCLLLSSTNAFSSSTSTRAAIVFPQLSHDVLTRRSAVILMAQRDASRSGTKRERLDRLADLEEERIETDKGFVVKAAGAFVGLLVLLLAVALSTVEGPI